MKDRVMTKLLQRKYVTAHHVDMSQINWIGQCRRCGSLAYRAITEGKVLCVYEQTIGRRSTTGNTVAWATERERRPVGGYAESCMRPRYTRLTKNMDGLLVPVAILTQGRNAYRQCNGKVSEIRGDAVWAAYRIGGLRAIEEMYPKRFDGGYVVSSYERCTV
jgi:hypothetical protein